MMPVRTELPTRVVYVGTDDEQDPPRLYPGNGEIDGYVALSYCWGGSQKRHQTERNRIDEYMHVLSVERLPKTLQDAIRLTRTLGIQYIWIDSLCIIQDCDEDKNREMARMANIYKNAIFTISAARARSCDDGFLGEQERRAAILQQLSIKLPMNCLNGAIGSVLLYDSREQFGREDTPVNKRAWTYQEQLLSRRVVSFYDDAVEWSCPGCHISDDKLGTDELGVTDPTYLEERAWFSERTDSLSQFLCLVSEYGRELPDVLATLPDSWWSAVYEYTMGSLSNLDDKLPAIAGIASEFQGLAGDVYVAGLWMSHLITDLRWRTGKQLKESSSNPGNRDFKYDAPTWSWASIHECIIDRPYRLDEYDLESNRVEIIDCKVNLVSSFAPFGSVNGGKLVIRAPLKSLSDKQVKEMLAQRFCNSRSIGILFLDNRSRHHADEPTTPHDGAAPHIESTGVWFLGLSKHPDLNYEPGGLALAKRGDGLFERIGVFQMYVGEDWLEYGTTERNELRSSWGDDYVITTVTIV
ncbi:unnamed protein product [Alternaria burnsii]|nr:unnamed protein product [Alternaria burnsii]